MPVYKGTPTKDGRKYFFSVSWSVGGESHRYKSKKYKFLEDCKKAEFYKKCTSFVPETIKKEGKVALTQRRITVC